MGVELNVRALGLEEADGFESGGDKVVDPRRNPEVTEGMIPRVAADLLERLDDIPESFEYTVRCSFVEIYLERVCDLLQPWREDVRIGKDERGEACVVGACEVCCLDVADIYALLARGNAYRTKAATDQNMDSSRSHAVVTLRLEMVNRENGSHTSSRLLLLDLAGSEVGRQKSTRGKETAIGLEGRMINASLLSLGSVIRMTLAEQGKKKVRVNPRANTSASKLAQLLKPCFGGNWFTTIICTGSPSSYNINETINTIKFGQQAREIINTPQPAMALTNNACKARLVESERRQNDLTAMVKMLAHECKHVKGRTKGKDSGNVPLWEAIEKIVSSTKPGDETEIGVILGPAAAVATKGDEEQAHRIAELEKQVEEHRLAREKAESGMRDLKSEITSLRRQKESITNEKQRMSRELYDAKEEMKILAQRNLELENFLRTSQFREKEAVLFLRQFRTFYVRLLKSKAAQGTGTTKDITTDVSQRIPGVSDLSDLLDVDKLMLDSGLIEKSELGSDTGTMDYAPSSDAQAKSEKQARIAEQKELQLIEEQFGDEIEDETGRRVSITNNGGLQHTELSFGQLASYRQRLLESPAGRLAVKKEQELERDLLEMGKKVVILQNSLIAEKAMVEALSARQGAMGKMKAAQELNMLKQELERKTNDLHAIVWKMNELHLVNKTIDTKVESREQHVNYLEEHLVDLQARNRRLVVDRQEIERRLREENTLLQDQLNGMATQIWQLGDSAALPLWRIVVPYTGEQVELALLDEEQQRRLSLGNLEDEEIDGLIRIVEKG